MKVIIFNSPSCPPQCQRLHLKQHLPCILLTLPISTFSPSISHGAYLANLHLFPLNQLWCLPCQSPPVPPQSAMVLTMPISTCSPSISHGAYLANLHLFPLNQPWCLPCQSPPVPPQSAMVLTLPMMVLTLPISTRSPSISHGAYLANDGAYLANLHPFPLNQPWCLPCQ